MSNAVGPYYQRYDRSKGYVQLMAVPGRVAQVSEWNDLGAMFLDFLKQYGNASYSPGTIISGCEITIQDNRATIHEGQIYLDGLIRDVEETVLDITGVGEEYITAVVKERIVTEADDESLYDPCATQVNFGQPGCHAVQQWVELGVNQPDAPSIFSLKDGAIATKQETTNTEDVIYETLARRTYDESGNYRVNGLRMRAKGTETADGIDISITEGKAYILGYEINYPTARTFQVEKAKSERVVQGETHSMVASNTQKIFQLHNTPVSHIIQITVTLSITEEVTRGAIQGGVDYMPHNPVYEIDTVKQGEKTYVRGEDWQRSGDAVDWSLLGEEPAIGSKYQVTYRYNYNLEDTDFALTVDYDKGTSKIQLTNVSPVENSIIYINYEFYLSRKDKIFLDKDGVVQIYKGLPDVLRQVEAPANTDDTLLPLGTITIPANQSNVMIVDLSIDSSTMEDIQKTIERVNDLEYNQAVSDLDDEAMSGEPPTELRGIFTDKFIGFSKADPNHDEWDAAIDIDNEEVTLPAIANIVEGVANGSNFDSQFSYMGDVITAPFVEIECLSQPLATRTMLVNPYAVFDPMVPVIAKPNTDNWIEQSSITVENTKVTTTSLRRFWYHGGESWTSYEKKKWLALGFTSDQFSGKDNKSITTTSSSVDILTEAIPFMRQRDVQITAYGFEPLSDNIEVYFDDRKVAFTGTDNCRGTKEGTGKADGTGTMTGKFTIPANIPCGTKSIKVKYAGDDIRYPKEGDTTYTANGIKQITKTTIFKQTLIVKTVDPLAQAFQFDKEYYLTSVDLYFATKDPVLPVTVQIRNMVNGYPGNICYAEAIVPASSIKTSADATVATKANFLNTVKCMADTLYCVVVMSDSNLPSLWLAKLGEKEVKSQKVVTSNPYTAGVLFSSSNALTWTAHQDMDLKFTLRRAQYQGKGVIIFNDIPLSAADRIMLAIDELDPADTNAQWYYKVNKGPWEPITLFNEKETSVVANTISLKVEFTAQNNRSPMIAADNLQLAYFLNKQEARYISRNVHLEEKYNNIKFYLDVATPQNTEFHVYYATDVNGTKWREMTNPTRQTVDEEFIRYFWNLQNLGSLSDFRVKIVLNTNNVLFRPRAKRMMAILKTL